MEATLFLIGAIGFLGMTWLFPLAGRFFWRVRAVGISNVAEIVRLRKVAIVIPAHNEEMAIAGTLQSIQRAIKYAQIYYPEVAVSVLVGADGCNDRTARVARHKGATVVENPRRRGKWRTLIDLIEISNEADWVVLADCGVAWPEDFLARAFPHCTEPHVIGVAPSYSNPRGGVLERIHWQVEKHFKKLEGLAGGPVSIHGATVLYRRRELLETVRGLPALNWLNDDVVLPLALRTCFPDGQISYLDNLRVFDQPPLKLKSPVPNHELGRRKRMVQGNVQWIRALFTASIKTNAIAGTLALRRIFRIFWAYWFLLIYIAAAGMLVDAMGEDLALRTTILALPAAMALVFPSLRRVLEAGIASLLAPYFLMSNYQFERAVWR